VSAREVKAIFYICYNAFFC